MKGKGGKERERALAIRSKFTEMRPSYPCTVEPEAMVLDSDPMPKQIDASCLVNDLDEMRWTERECGVGAVSLSI